VTRAVKVVALFAAAVGVVGIAGGQPDPNPLLKLAKAAKDGKLSQDDFLKAFAKSPKGKENPEFGKLVFSKLDANKDGFLTADELKAIGDKKGGKLEKAPDKAPPGGSGFNDNPMRRVWSGELPGDQVKKIIVVSTVRITKCEPGGNWMPPVPLAT